MSIIFYKQIFHARDDAPVMQIQISKNKVSCTYKDISKDFIFANVRYSPDKCNIYYASDEKNTKGIYFQWLSDIKEDKTGDSYTWFRYELNNALNRIKLCSIFIDSANNFHIIPYFQYNVILEDEIEENTFSENVDPLTMNVDYQELLVRYNAKRDLIAKINILDSLASLEAQVDLLFDLFVNGNANDAFKAAMSENSVLHLHDKQKLIDTIKQNKRYIRELQSTYLARKGNINPFREGA